MFFAGSWAQGFHLTSFMRKNSEAPMGFTLPPQLYSKDSTERYSGRFPFIAAVGEQNQERTLDVLFSIDLIA